jgi:hypothetical protein
MGDHNRPLIASQALQVIGGVWFVFGWPSFHPHAAFATVSPKVV